MKFDYVTSVISKQMSCQDNADGNNPTLGAMHYFGIIWCKCIQLISQVFAELSFLNDDFQINYNPRNLGFSTNEIQVKFFTSFQKATRSQLNSEFGISC